MIFVLDAGCLFGTWNCPSEGKSVEDLRFLGLLFLVRRFVFLHHCASAIIICFAFFVDDCFFSTMGTSIGHGILSSGAENTHISDRKV